MLLATAALASLLLPAPPDDWRWGGCSRSPTDPSLVHPRMGLRHGLQEGQVQLQKSLRKLVVRWIDPRPFWEIDPNMLLGPFSGSGSFPTSLEQTFRCDFVPTAFVPLDSDTWVVAGHERSGPARIERWELAWPEAMPGWEQDALGLTRLRLVAPERASATALWRGDQGSPERPVDLEVLRGADGAARALVVLFSDFRELHRLDLASGELTLLASPVRAGAPLGLLPLLDQGGWRFEDMPEQRPDLAGALLLAFPDDYRSHDPRPALALWDRDGDGELDLATEERIPSGLVFLPWPR